MLVVHRRLIAIHTHLLVAHSLVITTDRHVSVSHVDFWVKQTDFQ